MGDDINCSECMPSDGSRQWMIDFINNPAHVRFYGRRNDRMPAFGAEKMLDQQAIEMVVDWLRGEWFEPEKEIAGK